MHAIIIVLVLPPNESLSIRVSFESRYGMCEIVFLREFYDRVVMQFPKANNDLLMFAPYSIFLEEFKESIFYEPAKSIMNSLAVILYPLPFSISTCSWIIA